MLVGLLWLVFYDGAILATYTRWYIALAVAGLAPLSYLMVLAMRAWSRALWVAQAPEYKRARPGPGSPA